MSSPILQITLLLNVAGRHSPQETQHTSQHNTTQLHNSTTHQSTTATFNYTTTHQSTTATFNYRTTHQSTTTPLKHQLKRVPLSFSLPLRHHSPPPPHHHHRIYCGEVEGSGLSQELKKCVRVKVRCECECVCV